MEESYWVAIFWTDNEDGTGGGEYGGGTKCGTFEKAEQVAARHKQLGYGKKQTPIHIIKVVKSKEIVKTIQSEEDCSEVVRRREMKAEEAKPRTRSKSADIERVQAIFDTWEKEDIRVDEEV